jgi:uncharacterized repeat protein (TIGR03843 family)
MNAGEDSAPADAAQADPAEVLGRGELEVKGRMPWSSNATFLVEASLDGSMGLGVYKPGRGERPLHDFPAGLYRREVAMYELSEQLGWRLVPLTIERDGPLGMGSVQHFVDADFEQHYFTLVGNDAYRDALQRLCLLDVVANNTDRKGGHCLVDSDDHIWGIDNGLSFHARFKLRTVIWEWSGEPIPDAHLEDLATLCDTGLATGVTEPLDAFERDAILARTRALLHARAFPIDDTGHRYPWPLV